MSRAVAQASAQAAVPLHRVRFFDYTPTPISALAFAPVPLPPPSDPSSSSGGPAAAAGGSGGKGKARLDNITTESRNELGTLVLAREGGEVEIWGYVQGDSQGMGNWVLEKVLPPTLTHPTISQIALTVRDPAQFHLKPYRVPKIEDLRLFTAGSDSSDITERCLLTGRVLSLYPIPSAPLWSMAVSPTHTLLALSTTSPTMHFLTIPASGPLEPAPPHLLRSESLPGKTRTVSIAWGPPKLVEHEGDWEWRDTYLVTGNSDSCLRKWEISPPDPNRPGAGRLVLRGRAVVEKLARGGKGGRKAVGNQKGTIVWGVGVLPDHSIVTSDSLGNVVFWDGASLAQRQSFTAHKADAMCLVIGPGGHSVYTSGPDQRVCQFAQRQGSSGNAWNLAYSKRMHSHDVRALAVFPPYTPLSSSHPLLPAPLNPGLAPVLASGGFDMQLVLTPAAVPGDGYTDKLRNPLGKTDKLSKTLFEESYARKMGYLSGGRGNGFVSIAREARLLLGRKQRSVGIWRIRDEEEGWEKVLEMDLRLRTNLIASAISSDGQWVAISDLYETKLFRLTSTPSGAIKPLRIRSFLQTLENAPALSHLSLGSTGSGSSALLFTPDNGRLIMGMAASGQVVVLSLRGEEVQVEKCFERDESVVAGRVVKNLKAASTGVHVVSNGTTKPNGNSAKLGEPASEDEEEDSDGDDDADELRKRSAPVSQITTLSASDDGQWLAVSALSASTHLYNLDTLQPYAVLPTFPSAPAALLFPPSQPSLLAIVLPDNSFNFYHIEQRRLLNPNNQIQTLNKNLKSNFLPLQGAVFEPSRKDSKNAKVLVWSNEWIATARLDLDPIARTARRDGHGSGLLGSKSLRKKRAREAREALEAVAAADHAADADDPMSAQSTPHVNGHTVPNGAVASAPYSPSVQGSSTGTSLTHASLAKGPSSADDPEFVKIIPHRFQGVGCADWLAEAEIVVVERPWSDLVGGLPPALWTGSFGRS